MNDRFEIAPLADGMTPFGTVVPMEKAKRNTMADSLFSMTKYDFRTQQVSSESSVLLAQPAAFSPVDDYKDLTLREILALSEECLFSDVEEDSRNSPPPPPPLYDVVPLTATANIKEEDLQWNELEEIPVSGEDIPVAAALVASLDDVDASFVNFKKRNHEFEEEPKVENPCIAVLGVDQDNSRFRPYQACQWSEKFEELCLYRKANGHCLVPHTYRENLPLARWVKRQRYQYKLMKEGKPSTMTEDRVKDLEDIGFVWDSQGAAWSERLEELRAYQRNFGHCNVPSNYSVNPQLATWVKCQRRQYKLYHDSKPSNMTANRIQELEVLGFEWELRTYKKARIC